LESLQKKQEHHILSTNMCSHDIYLTTVAVAVAVAVAAAVVVVIVVLSARTSVLSNHTTVSHTTRKTS
jgi:hypothetical protein